MAAKPLIVYFHNEHTYRHPRRVYVAARSRTRAWQISGISQETLKGAPSNEAGTAWAPRFITEEGVWLEIRDHDVDGWIYADHYMDQHCHRRAIPIPANEAAFIRAASLEACKEAFTLRLDRALAAAGVPREDL